MPLSKAGLVPEYICPHEYTLPPMRPGQGGQCLPLAHISRLSRSQSRVSAGVTAATFISLKAPPLGEGNQTSKRVQMHG